MTRLIHINNENIIDADRVITISTPNSSSTKKAVADAKASNTIIDMTTGKAAKAVVTMNDGWIVLCSLSPQTIAKRMKKRISKGGLS